MSELHRIGTQPSAEQLWGEAMRLLAIAQARPSIDNMTRVVDVWRQFQEAFRKMDGRPAA